jgi:hypothetical protein
MLCAELSVMSGSAAYQDAVDGFGRRAYVLGGVLLADRLADKYGPAFVNKGHWQRWCRQNISIAEQLYLEYTTEQQE